MKLPKFIVSIILTTCLLPAYPCGGPYRIDPNMHYLFFLGSDKNYYWDWKTVDNDWFKKENIDFWHQYVNQEVSRKAVEQALYGQNAKSPFWKVLEQRNDTVAMQYWHFVLGAYGGDRADATWKKSSWYYPSSKEERKTDFSFSETADENILKHCKNSQIRDRYVYQLMQRAFYDMRYQECLKLWEQYGEQIPTSALQRQCKSYYAGALCHLERKADAAIAYAQIGYYDRNLHYNVDVLRKIHQNNPDCPSFEFIVQHFVSEYFDMQYEHFNADNKQSKEFIKLADNILENGSSRNPALWQSAKAAIAYINKDKATARRWLNEADRMAGSQAVKDNIRMMRLIFNAADATTAEDADDMADETAYEARLLPDLKWLVNQVRKHVQQDKDYFSWNSYEDHWIYTEGTEKYGNRQLHQIKVLRRAILVEIVPHFERSGRKDRAMAYLNMYSNILSDYRYGSRFFCYMDNAETPDVEKYWKFLQTKGTTEMDKFLLRYSYKNRNFYNELLGTKYLRLEKWDGAIAYFQKVSKNYTRSLKIQEYITDINPFREEWITNNRCGQYKLQDYSPVDVYQKSSSKLQFCQIMKEIERQMVETTDPETRAQAAYAYAVGLYQSSIGKSWALSRYCRGIVNSMYEMYYTPDLASCTRVHVLTDKAKAITRDQNLSDKCFALLRQNLQSENAYTYPYPGYENFSSYESYEFAIESWINNRELFEKKGEANLLAEWSKRNNRQMTENIIRSTFCDGWEDYQGYWDRKWRNSTWYYADK